MNIQFVSQAVCRGHVWVLRNISLAGIAAATLLAGNTFAQTEAPYRVLDTTQLMGSGPIDYVLADNDARQVYVPRGTNTFVFGLDDHKYVGVVAGVGGHGIAIDTASHHGFASGPKIGMFDTETLQKIKDIEVAGRPDGILLEPYTGKVLVFSHKAPSITLIDPKDGIVTGTIDVGGAMEQAQSDGHGKLYVNCEDEKQIAVVDLQNLKLVKKYDLGETSGEPAGLGFDRQNHLLFAMCARPDVCVVVNADDGKVLATLPIGSGTDNGAFNPATMEAFSSQRDGTFTVIKESSPTSFTVEQTLATKPGCKTCSLDTKNNRLVLICTERLAAAGGSAPATNAPAAGQRGPRGGPGNLDVLWVGR